MHINIIRRGFIPVLLLASLALLWPSFAVDFILLGSVVWVAAIWGVRASGAGMHITEAEFATVPHKVKYS